MPIYAQERVINRIRKVYDYAFEEQPYPGAPRIVAHQINKKPFSIKGVEVLPIPIVHGQLPYSRISDRWNGLFNGYEFDTR
jgi:phosphoribosyl 1,2-cyclic phosphate phosphodiesterase